MHGVYENVHPTVSMSKIKGNYIAGLIGYDHFPNNEIMRRHYNGTGDVWWSADVLETDFGKGKWIYHIKIIKLTKSEAHSIESYVKKSKKKMKGKTALERRTNLLLYFVKKKECGIVVR